MSNNNNNSFDPLQRNFNPRTINRLNISEQLDLIYNENNNLKNYIKEQEYMKNDLIRSYEANISSLEYEKSIIIKETNSNYRLYDEKVKDLNNEITKLRTILIKTDEQKELLNADYQKLEERHRVANEYIKVLPTPHESDRLNINLSNLKKSNERYKTQLNEAQRIILKLENELTRKNVELASNNDRVVLMKSQMDVLSEKLGKVQFSSVIKEECTENWSSSPDLIEDMKLTLQQYKKELLHSRQIIESEKKKFNQITVNYQRQIDDLQKQLESESETIVTLKREIDQKQFVCCELEQKLKSAVYEKQDCLDNMMDLQIEIDRVDNYGSDIRQQLFDKLLSEVLKCTREIEKVSQWLWKLFNKEELDISELLGCCNFDSLTITDADSRSIDKQQLEQYFCKVKAARAQLSQITDSIRQLYTKEMASDAKFCITQ